jgi:phage-related protein
MAENIDVGITIKGVDKGVADLNKLAGFAENLGDALSGADKDVGLLEGGLDKMTKGAYSGFKKGAEGIKTFIVGLKATKTAIIATGIGALVVAFGLLVVYWDDIKEAVTGVNEEQKLLLKYAEGTRDAAQAQLNYTSQTESTLRLAGKSERDILNLKTQQTNEIILATEQILLQQKQQKEGQIKAAERNQKITRGYLRF